MRAKKKNWYLKLVLHLCMFELSWPAKHVVIAGFQDQPVEKDEMSYKPNVFTLYTVQPALAKRFHHGLVAADGN